MTFICYKKFILLNVRQVPVPWFMVGWLESVWFIGQDAYCLIKLSKNFFKTRV